MEVGGKGNWTESVVCPGTDNKDGFLDKLDFKASGNLGDGLGDKDNTGVDGFRWCCTVGWGWITPVEGYKGAWKKDVACPQDHAIYGFQTKISTGGDDEIGLVAAKFFCAPVGQAVFSKIDTAVTTAAPQASVASA